MEKNRAYLLSGTNLAGTEAKTTIVHFVSPEVLVHQCLHSSKAFSLGAGRRGIGVWSWRLTQRHFTTELDSQAFLFS